MKENRHFVEKRIWFSKWYKWIALALFILFFLCFLPKCCSNKPIAPNSIKQVESDSISFNIDPYKRRIIDTEKIEIINDDPLNRLAINDLINVYLNDNVNIEEFYINTIETLANHAIVVTDTAEVYKRIQFQVAKDEKEDIMNVLRQDILNVKFVTYEWLYKRATTQLTDPDFNIVDNTWFYEKIGVFDAWNYTRGNPSIKIAILDDGFDLNHNELKNKFILPWNVINYNDKVYADAEDLFHGTHVAGSIIAEANNGFGISGVAPDCTFIPIQISDKSGYISTSALLDGIFYALKNKADIINLSIAISLGQMAEWFNIDDQEFIRSHYLKDEERLWKEVFEIAQESNVIIVQAAGNDNILAGVDPMNRNEFSITVGAVNEYLELSDFTNYGQDVDVFAPGTNIYSSLPNNEMGYLDGTSMASPIVAGAIALIKSHSPNLQAEEIISMLRTQSSTTSNNLIDLGLLFNDVL